MVSQHLIRPPAGSAPWLVIVTARCWRKARDYRRPPQPALFAILTEHRCGVLAPVFDGVLRAYEACLGRPIRVGGPTSGSVSADERRLIELLESSDSSLSADEMRARPGLVPTMRIALRSARLLLRQARTTSGSIVSRAVTRKLPTTLRGTPEPRELPQPPGRP